MPEIRECGVMIASHNRREDLARTLDAIRTLNPAPAEIMVCLDACSDGSGDMLRRSFPSTRLLENDRPLGSVGSRDRMLRAARCDLVLSLDDDSHPVEPDFLARAASHFSRLPRLAVACFPQRSEEFPESLTRASFGAPRLVGSYAASGAMLRRATYLSLPGFPPIFFHAYEEPDYALQCHAAGWQVLRLTDLTIRHRYSGAGRNEIRTHHQHARNEALSALMRCPAPLLPAVLPFRAMRQLVYACSRGHRWTAREPAWWLSFLRLAPSALAMRRPVGWQSYLAWMRLLRHPAPVPSEWLPHNADDPHNPPAP